MELRADTARYNETRESDSRLVRRGRCMVALGLTASLLSGCGAPASAFDWEKSGRERIYATYPCNPAIDDMILSGPISIEAANRCIEDRNKPIALVNFGLPDDFAHAVAERAEQVIEDAYDDLVDAELEVIEPNPAAWQVFNLKRGHDGCHEGLDISSFGSHIADIAMDLDDYGAVVALTDDVSCEGMLGATPNNNHRIIEMFQPKPGTYLENRVGLNAQVLAHEYGHAKFNLAHSGELFGNDYRLNYESPNGGLYNALPKAPRIDIVEDLLKRNAYIVYGDDPSIMGGNFANPPYYLNGTQRQQVRWADRKLSGEPKPEVSITPQQEMVAWPDSKQHEYAYLNLREPLRVEGFLTTKSTRNSYEFKSIETNQFDRLVFDPVVEDNHQTRLMQVYLSGEDGVILSLGHIKLGGQVYRQVFVVGQQEVELVVDGDGFSVRSNY